MSFKLLTLIMGVLMVAFVTSCKDDEEEKIDYTPVLNKNFSFVVNENTVSFTTTLDGNVWFTANEIDYPCVDKKVDVFLAKAGTYSFTCSSLGSGSVLTSTAFDVIIAEDNLDFLDTELWKALSGGKGNTKTWRMDINTDGKCFYFPGPLSFSGYANGDERKTEWAYWAWDVLPSQLPFTVNGVEMSSFFNWSPEYATNTWIMAANNYGTITFDGNDGTVSTTIFGETKNGSFSFDTATWKLTLSGLTLPIDTGRVNEGQYLDEDLINLRIFTLVDSGMQIGIKRSFEGGATSEWVNVYNFICDDYTYETPEVFTFEESVNTSFTKDDLVGTWKFGDVPMGWISYTKVGDQGTTIPAYLYEVWNTRTDAVTTLSGWGLTAIDSVFTANDANTYVFNADGTCELNGVENTFSVSNGVITFTNALSTEFLFSYSWLNHVLAGTDVKVINVSHYGSTQENYTYDGIWIGQKNGDKTEYSGFHLEKQ